MNADEAHQQELERREQEEMNELLRQEIEAKRREMWLEELQEKQRHD